MNIIRKTLAIALPKIKMNTISKTLAIALPKIKLSVWWWAGISTVVAVFCTVALIVELTPYRHLDSLKDKAQVTANAGELATSLDTILAKMQELNMTTGYVVPLLKNPSENLGEMFPNIKVIKEQADQIAALPVTTEAYQSGMDNLHDTLVRLNINAVIFGLVRSIWYYLMWAAWTWAMVAITNALSS